MSGPGGDDRPRNVDAERMILGACLIDPDAVGVVARTLRPDDFYRVPHQTIFSTLVEQWETGYPTDPVSMVSALEQRGELIRVGGAPYVHTLYSECPTSASVGWWADEVAEKAARARLVDAADRARQLAVDSSDDLSAIQERAQTAFDEAVASRVTDDADGTWVHEAIDDRMAEWNHPRESGVSSPFYDVNDVIGDVYAGQMIIIAARPSIGKSTLAMDWATHAAGNGKTVVFISLEMTRGELIDRMISARAGIRITEIRDRTLSDYHYAEAVRARDHIIGLPLYIADQYVSTLGKIRAKAREIKRHHGLDMLIVDHVGLVESAGREQSRHESVSAISRGLKLLAKELGVPVFVVAQLNREVEKRTDKVPMLADLRDSGSLEQDSDIAILINRPDFYEREIPRAGEADFLVAKNRNGPTATITVCHQLHYSRFTNLARG